MTLPLQDIVIFGIGSFMLFVWMIIFIMSRKYDSIFAALDEKEYPLKELFSTGYGVMELFHYQYKSNADRKLRKEVEILFGEKYAEFYIRVTYAQRVTYAMLVFLAGFVIYGLAGEIAILLVTTMFSGLAYYYFGQVVNERIQKRSDQMLHDFSEAIAKLALLTNAGMILREAWEVVAQTNDHVLYKEMQSSVDEMNNGVSEIEAIRRFGTRCIIPEIKKFTTTIIQGMTKGNKELTMMLQNQSKEVWGLKKQLVRRQGEKAASKLIIPIMIMFVGILIMVIVPIFANLGV